MAQGPWRRPSTVAPREWPPATLCPPPPFSSDGARPAAPCRALLPAFLPKNGQEGPVSSYPPLVRLCAQHPGDFTQRIVVAV